MKLVTFTLGDNPRLGLVRENEVIDLTRASQGHLPTDMLTFLQQGQAALEMAQDIEQSAAADLPLAEVKLLAPITNPSKVVAIGLNYMDHCREQKVEPPKAPIIFAKFPSSIIGPGEAIRWNPALTKQVDYEAELAVVMGRTARNVAEAEALDYVAGYTICHDVSARDLQLGDGQWIRGKSLDTFCPLGPYLVTRDEIPNPHNLAIRCTVNDAVLQNSNTAEMIFRIPYLIAYISRAFTLLPGDVITTGTPDGVGIFRSPKIFLKGGDVVTVEIEGLGQLINPCLEEQPV
ncbi:MAG TPA: fumarylacetoacetate hydrolase family protein [Anaerolineae bacterium]|nr:fumarylacetoacetate hydrolase family protein [Anaerolineae bacterium]